MPPYRVGWNDQRSNFWKTTYADLPYKFEAGTPNIADVVAFKASLEFIGELGKQNIAVYEDKLLKYATEKLSEIEGLTIVGQAKDKVSVVSFVLKIFTRRMWESFLTNKESP